MSGARTAIVTGGASGIGAACVRRFLKDGISVVALDLNNDLLKKMQSLSRCSVSGFISKTRIIFLHTSRYNLGAINSQRNAATRMYGYPGKIQTLDLL